MVGNPVSAPATAPTLPVLRETGYGLLNGIPKITRGGPSSCETKMGRFTVAFLFQVKTIVNCLNSQQGTGSGRVCDPVVKSQFKIYPMNLDCQSCRVVTR